MLKKSFIKIVIAVLVTVFVFTPFSASAAIIKDANLLSGIGKDFIHFMGKQGVSSYDSLNTEKSATIEVTENSAIILLGKSYLNITAEQYNLMLNNWSPIKCEHNGNTVEFNNLQDSSFYKVRLNYLGKSLGEYSFFTKPKCVTNLNLSFDDKEKCVNLSWENPRGFITEVFKKEQSALMWKYVGMSRGTTFKDENIPDGAKLSYKLRFVCKNSEADSFSDFSKVSNYIDEIDMLETTKDGYIVSRGYTIIRQNDPVNRLIPYPYEDNGKTIGTSGCGVCAALMVIRNTTNYDVTLQDFTNQCLATGCRQQYGSDMLKIAQLTNKYYSMTYSVTKDVNKLKEHLEKGYMATAHVGTKLYFTRFGGHFVTVAGVLKGATRDKDRVIVLDPSFSESKYSEALRVNAGIEFSSDGLVVSSFETLLADCKGEYFVLYTPDKSVAKTASAPDKIIPKPVVPAEKEYSKKQEEEKKKKEKEQKEQEKKEKEAKKKEKEKKKKDKKKKKEKETTTNNSDLQEDVQEDIEEDVTLAD